MTGLEQYEFGEFVLDVTERRLLKGADAVPLAPKAHDLLVALVRHGGRLVTKGDLLTAVWPDSFVEEGILSVHVSGLRKAIGDTSRPSKYIETVSRTGYRFMGATRREAPFPFVPGGAIEVRRPAVVRPLEAQEQFGLGRAHVLSASSRELPRAIAAFRAAIDLDPTYAAAYAGLALAHCAEATLRARPHLEAHADARTAALRALALDGECGDAQVALATVLFLSEWDWVGAERSLIRALDINPNHTEAYLLYGSLMEALGQLDRGLHFKQQALERDPFSPLVLVQIATAYWHQRRYDEAIVWADKALDIDPRHLLAREFLAGAYWKKGDFDRLMTENIKQAESFGMTGDALAHVKQSCVDMSEAYAAGGHASVARYRLRLMPGDGPALQLAILHAAAGDMDAAFHDLNRVIDSRDPCLVHLAVAPQWDNFRTDARFSDCLVKMGLGQPIAPPASPGPSRR
jgi:DNA-binding winged helix-turn-helix (wHTH) protein/cytochrome c-type biogenesis protein CcmH/NrfG